LSSPTHTTHHLGETLNLHPTVLHGLDISEQDLKFAVQDTSRIDNILRWEECVLKLWKGGLETWNKDFVDIECIVASEVSVRPLPILRITT
jgi:small RNA 2'-O-methyltransferase